jgi:hypothetical protein
MEGATVGGMSAYGFGRRFVRRIGSCGGGGGGGGGGSGSSGDTAWLYVTDQSLGAECRQRLAQTDAHHVTAPSAAAASITVQSLVAIARSVLVPTQLRYAYAAITYGGQCASKLTFS